MYAHHLEPNIAVPAIAQMTRMQREQMEEQESRRDCRGGSADSDDPNDSCAQTPIDVVDEALMESFPCSDPPSYNCSHS